MKFLSAALLSLATLASAQSYVKTSGTKFTIDGATKYFAGSNSYWISFLTNNADVDKTMSEFKASGLKILRVWGFNDLGSGSVYFQSHSNGKSTINTGANGLQRLDYVVKAAEANGIKLIIPFVNNWDDYGGIAAYNKAYGISTKTDWFTNSKTQAAYKAYIAAVVARYKTSTAIFAWELMNEPRCPGCNTDVVYNWVVSTSAYIKGLDSNHLVTIGDEGFGLAGASTYPYGTSEGLDFAKNLKAPNIDFGVFHFYPQSWGVTEASGSQWAKDHAAICKAAGKPCIFEEYGTTGNKCSVEPPWQETSRTTDGMGADLFWQWGTTLSTGKTHNDGYSVYYNEGSEYTCVVTNHVKAIGKRDVPFKA